jgi:hypothetical protein
MHVAPNNTLLSGVYVGFPRNATVFDVIFWNTLFPSKVMFLAQDSARSEVALHTIKSVPHVTMPFSAALCKGLSATKMLQAPGKTSSKKEHVLLK